MHRLSRILALSASLLVSLSLHAAPPSMTTSTETVTVSTPGVVTFPSGRQLSQTFTAAERASTVPVLAGQLGWETDTGLVYRATGTNAGDWTLTLQAMDSDLTDIAALTSTAYGRSVLESANAAALRTLAGLGTAATATIATAVTNNAVPTIHFAAGTPNRAITGFSTTGKIFFTTPTGTGSPVWAGSPTFTGSPKIGAGFSGASSLEFYDSEESAGNNYVGIRAPASLSANYTLTLPSADGTNGQAMVTNGAGQLSFATISSGITIGTTTANGTAGRVLYTDGSTVQQYATTGTGDVVRGTSPTITGLAASSITGTALTLAGGTLTGPLMVDGSTDAVQMTIQGHSTQTNHLFLVEKSDGTDLLRLANDGKITLSDGANIHNNTADTLAFVVGGQSRMTIFGSLGFILTGTDYHDSYTGSQYSSSGNSRDVQFRATATGIWEQIKSGTQQYYRVFASDATKYLQLTHDGTNAVITPSSGGVSMSGEVFLNLPTSAGTSGSLWNDGGTVKVAP